MPEPYRIQEVQEDGAIRLAWDNRTVPKQNGLTVILVLLWLVWAPATVYMMGVIFRGEVALWFAVLWFVLGWLGTLGIPIGLLGRWRSEWVAISPHSITCGSRGMLAPKARTYPIGSEGQPLELVFGFLPSRVAIKENRTAETMITLSLFVPSRFGFRKRILLGYWLAPAIKAQIFTAIRTFVAAHNMPVIVKTYGVPEEGFQPHLAKFDAP